MTHVATLISHPQRPVIGAMALDRAGKALHQPEAAIDLATGVAVDIPFTPDTGLKAIEARLRSALEGVPVDLVLQERAGRRKRLLLADMDSTMIGQECIDELADFVGARSQVAAITARAMRGEIEFEPALRERVALLEGLPVAVITDVIASRIFVTSGAVALVATMKANRAHTELISGGFTLFADWVAREIGFDGRSANRLDIRGGKLTGKVLEPILGRRAKKERLVALRREKGLEACETLAVGDGANDIDMLGEAGLGVAYHAKPAVAAQARMRVDHGDLTALLYAQGYAVTDILGLGVVE